MAPIAPASDIDASDREGARPVAHARAASRSRSTYTKIAAALLLPIIALAAWQIDSRRLGRATPMPAPVTATSPAGTTAEQHAAGNAAQSVAVLTDAEITQRLASLAPPPSSELPGELRPPPPINIRLALPLELPLKAPHIPVPDIVIKLALPLELPTKGPKFPLPEGAIVLGALAFPAVPPVVPPPEIAIKLALPLELPTKGPVIPLPEGSITLGALALPAEPPAVPAAEIAIKLALPLVLPTAPPHIPLAQDPPSSRHGAEVPQVADVQAASQQAHVCSLPEREPQVASQVPPEISATPENFGDRLAAVATAQTKEFVIYSARYTPISYPMGDVAALLGSCTDVVIRAYRALGIDLQELVYKSRSGVGDRSIDHRRTETLRRFFAAYGTSLPITDFHENYQPGDIVTYYRPHSRVSTAHIAIVSAEIAPSGRPMIIHNRGWGTQVEDALFVDRITGHYRFTGLSAPLLAERPKAAPQLPNPAVVKPSPAAYAAMGTGALAPIPLSRPRSCGGPEYSGLLKARPVACQPIVASPAAAPRTPVPRQASRANGAILAK